VLDLALWAEKILKLNVFLCNFKKCIHCGQMILRKISKIGATICQILRLKCTKFHLHWGSAPDPPGGAYSAPPDSIAVVKGVLFLRGGRGKGKGRRRKGEGKGRGGEGSSKSSPFRVGNWHRAPRRVNPALASGAIYE